MLLLCLIALLPQRLDPPSRVAYAGETVVLRARDRGGEPQPGITVTARWPSGEERVLGVADARGEVRFEPASAGRFEFRAEFPNGPIVFAVYHVADRPNRWLYALLFMPLGIWLIYRNVRRLRREESAT